MDFYNRLLEAAVLKENESLAEATEPLVKNAAGTVALRIIGEDEMGVGRNAVHTLYWTKETDNHEHFLKEEELTRLLCGLPVLRSWGKYWLAGREPK